MARVWMPYRVPVSVRVGLIGAKTPGLRGVGWTLGSGAPGYLSYSIATPTGEGVTTPLTFTRERQLAIGGALRII